MKEKNKVSASMIFIIFLIFGISMVFLTILLSDRVINTKNYFKDYNTFIDNNLSNQLRKQETIDNKIKDIASNGNYSLNNPCVLVNPYGINPLSAILIFNTINKESVTLYINDQKIGEDSESVTHIIPVVGLYNNVNNVVTLESSSGEKSTTTISTDSYNDNVHDFKLSKLLDSNKSSALLLGDINNNDSIIRGFDINNNMTLLLDFDYLSGFTIKNNHIFVDYNSMLFKNAKIKSLVLEMDFLGRIYSIKTDTSSINHNSNFVLEGSEYIAQSVNYYNDTIETYSLNKYIDSSDYSEYKTISTETLISKLDEAEIYKDDFDISLMGKYVSVDFKEQKVTLLMVNKYNNLIYSYEIDGSEMLKVNVEDDVSLYVLKDNKYYSLLTVLKK